MENAENSLCERLSRKTSYKKAIEIQAKNIILHLTSRFPCEEPTQIQNKKSEIPFVTPHPRATHYSDSDKTSKPLTSLAARRSC